MSSFSSYSFHQSQLYDCTTMPRTYTPTPSTTGWWYCCKCGREVDPEIHGNTCPDCPNHQKCATCTTKTHETAPPNDQLDFEPQIHGRSAFQAPTAGHHSHNGHALPVNDMPNPGYICTTPKCSMDGWWQCCQCSEEVNSGWCGTDCSACSHGYCDNCYNLGSTPIVV